MYKVGPMKWKLNHKVCATSTLTEKANTVYFVPIAQHTAPGFFKMRIFHCSLLILNIFMHKLYSIFLNSWFSPVFVFLSVLVPDLTFVSNGVDGLTWWIWKKKLSLISFRWSDGTDLAKTIESLPKSYELSTSSTYSKKSLLTAFCLTWTRGWLLFI